MGGLLLTVLFLITLGSAGPWYLRMGFIALAFGGLVIFVPPVVYLKKPLMICACGFLFFSWGAFLPVDFFTMPRWRREFNELGLMTGDLVTIQWKLALESQLSFILLFLAGLWIMGQRFSAGVSRKLIFGFILGVAAYALVSWVLQDQSLSKPERFGFFPNRNHSSVLLSLGFITGFGTIFQSLRSRKYFALAAALVLTGIILWAILFWNLSRSGIVLCGCGVILWLFLLGWRYFRPKEIRAFGLAGLLILGVYFIADFQVKDRIADTFVKITEVERSSSSAPVLGEAPETVQRLRDVDLRIPIAIDTLNMIKDAPLTGVGAGQFRWIFPQYREETLTHPDTTALHPESSWLWLAAELGVPAAACLFILVILLFLQGLANIKKQGNRDRALRLACLVGALLVPFHSFFDVSAHRPSLLLLALFLFAVAQNPDREQPRYQLLSRWPSVVVAGLFLAAGFRLLGTAWFGWNPPHLESAKEQLSKGASLYDQVSDLENPLPPFEALALRNEVCELAKAAREDAPLDGRFYRLSGLAMLPLEYQSQKMAQDFEVDRRLSPGSIRIPLIHASSALFYDQNEVGKGWLAAIERAQKSDSMSVGGSHQTDRVLRAITSLAARNPQLEELADEIKTLRE